MKERIKFCLPRDGMYEYYLSEIKEILNKIDLDKPRYVEVNDIIEFYNIIRYSKIKTSGLKQAYNNKLGYMHRLINNFLTTLNEDNFHKIYRRIAFEYLEDFWKLLNDNVGQVVFSEDFIKKVFKYKRFHITYILKCSNLAKAYKNSIKIFLIKFERSAELLINHYETLHDKTEDNLVLPHFTKEEIDYIFDKYINSQAPHMNYLEAILDIVSSEIEPSDEIKLLALKRIKKEHKILFDKDSRLNFGATVVFGDFDNIIGFNSQGNEYVYEYDTKWIKNNLDYPTLMNNFIYLFEFVDNQMRFTNISKKSEMALFEGLVGIHTKFEYKIGITFRIKEITALMQMIQYEQELKKHKLSIEKCIKWFYSKYLKNEFQIGDFLVHMPTSSLNSFEKCRIIFPEIDGIIKQFSIYQKCKYVDHELVEVSSNSILFEDVPSLNKKKYVYKNDEKTAKLLYLLFSNQSILHYLKGFEKYESFYKLIINERLKFNHFQKYQLNDLIWLKNEGYIKRNRRGIIEFKDLKIILILLDLYKNDVISYHHYSEEYQKTIDRLVKMDICYFEDRLFTKQEVKYLNYYLNNRNVSNGLSLRNRYGHGTQPRKDNKKIHDRNYICLLYIIVLITIKINDDICLFDKK